VLVITSDFEEIETLCARALVFTRGIHQVELSGADVNVAQIAACLAANKPKEAK
jgi:ribose transport system ATP-binding protein